MTLGHITERPEAARRQQIVAAHHERGDVRTQPLKETAYQR